jgi:hypothetical protein
MLLTRSHFRKSTSPATRRNSLVEQPERLRDRIRQLAKASVDEELHGTGQQLAANNSVP